MNKHQNKIERLITELCPKGVEFKELGEIIDYEQPGDYIVRSTEYSDDFAIPVLTAGKSFILGYTDETDGIYKANKENPTIIFDDFTTSFHWVDFEFKVKSSAMKMLRPQNSIEGDFRYIYYAMKCINYTPQDHARHWISQYSKIKIPVPPFEIQQEIVKILNNFTELEAEIEAEIEARELQYRHYRNKLLSISSDDVQWKTLGEVAEYRRGSFPQPYGENRWYGGENAMPFVQVADVGKNMRLVENTKQKISKLAQPKSVFVPAETVLVTLQGSIGRVAITQYDSYVDRTLAIFQRFNIKINKKYFAYQLEKKFAVEKETARGSTIKTITKEEFTKFKIPIPPIEEQERIVTILDKFDSLVNNVSVGLPAELAARRSQYEYYRNKLLTFKEYVQ